MQREIQKARLNEEGKGGMPREGSMVAKDPVCAIAVLPHWFFKGFEKRDKFNCSCSCCD